MNLEVSKDLETPTTIKAFQCNIGFVSFYRQYISTLAIKTSYTPPAPTKECNIQIKERAQKHNVHTF